jgi:hypothetical protein
VERIIRRITDQVSPVDVDRLLVVTFTNAAASEMRDRISRALSGELTRYPGSKHLQRQVALLGRAAISTIHSFCLDLLRQYFYRLELDPAFRVADATEAVLIQTEALEEMFERRYAAGDNLLFTGLVDSYGGRRDDTLLQELVLKAYDFARSTPDPAFWLEKLPESFNIPKEASPGEDYFDQLPWAAVLKKAVSMGLAGAQAELEQALRLARQPGGPQSYLANLAEDLAMVEDLEKACTVSSSWSDLYQGFQHAGFRKLAACRKEMADETLVEQVKKLRDAAKKKIYQNGFLVFSLGSLLCVCSKTMYFLIIARIVQGLGAAMMMECNFGIITMVFPLEERGRATGTLGTVVAIGTMVGPPLGGFLVGTFSWQVIFLINIPIGIIAYLAGVKYIPRDEVPKVTQEFDIKGIISFCRCLITPDAFNIRIFLIIICQKLIDLRAAFQGSLIDIIKFKNQFIIGCHHKPMIIFIYG